MTTFHQANLALSNGQLAKLNRAVKPNQPVTLRFKPGNFSGPHKFFLTQLQINKLRKANSKGVGMDLQISKNQIRKVTGGSLFSLATNNNNNIFIYYIKYTNITPPANSKANQGRWCADG